MFARCLNERGLSMKATSRHRDVCATCFHRRAPPHLAPLVDVVTPVPICAPVSVLGYHVILRLGDDRVIAPSRGERRRFARKLAALAREFPVLAWKLADTHLHVV